MRRERILITQEDIFTALKWWSILKLDGLDVMLMPGESAPPSSLVVARGATEDEAEKIYRSLNVALRMGMSLVDVANWESFADLGETGAET